VPQGGAPDPRAARAPASSRQRPRGGQRMSMRTFSPNVGARTRRQRREASHASESWRPRRLCCLEATRGVRGWQPIGKPTLAALLSSTRCVCLCKRATVSFFDFHTEREPQLVISISGMHLFSSRFVEMYFSQETCGADGTLGDNRVLSTAYSRTNCGLSCRAC
jgi:hypothetical protein